MSEEQVPSAPMKLLNGKPELTLGNVETLGTPLNNCNGVIIIEKEKFVNKEKNLFQAVSYLLK